MRGFNLYRVGGIDGDIGLTDQGEQHVVSMHHGDVDEEVLAGEAEIGTLDEEFPGGLIGFGEGHILGLSGGEAHAGVEL